jgi:hypothetical protein
LIRALGLATERKRRAGIATDEMHRTVQTEAALTK